MNNTISGHRLPACGGLVTCFLFMTMTAWGGAPTTPVGGGAPPSNVIKLLDIAPNEGDMDDLLEPEESTPAEDLPPERPAEKHEPPLRLDESPCLKVAVKQKAGQVFTVSRRINPGRYVLTFRLHAVPPWNAEARITCAAKAGDLPARMRELTGVDFHADGSPLEVELPVEMPPGTGPGSIPLTASVDWAQVWVDKDRQIRLYDVSLRRLDGGMGITRVFPNKLLYRPGETGTVAVTIHNFAAKEQVATLNLDLVQELDHERAGKRMEITVPAWQSLNLDLPLACDQREYGCEARVTLRQADTVLDVRGDVFNVSDNVWKVGLGRPSVGILSGTGALTTNAIPGEVQGFRDGYCNWWEKDFWPPDDWGDMTPAQSEWVSGQAERWEKKDTIKAVIAAVKPHGIKSITYGKHVACGPEGLELARRKPEWFYKDEDGVFRVGGQFHTWDLANWHDPSLHATKEGRKLFHGAWYSMSPDLRREDTLEWGIKELRESSKEYGWDGVRFDGHWTAGNDELSTWNMRHLKEAMWAVDTNYLFGFNFGLSYGFLEKRTAVGFVEDNDHETREALAGGGLYMQEGIGSWIYSVTGVYTSWWNYARQEAGCVEQVRKLDGSYCMIYGSWQAKPFENRYKFSIGTMGGAHPTYGEHLLAPGCANWGRYLTRWSAFFWDSARKPVAVTGAVDVVSSRPLWWDRWVRERVADEKTRHLMVHLLNPPLQDAINAPADRLPDTATNVIVRVRAPSGQTLARAVWLSPETAAASFCPLTVSREGEWAAVTIPRLDVWGTVIWEFSGSFKRPEPGPRFTEPPDPVKVAAGRVAPARPVATDPLKPNEPAGKSNRQWNYETDAGFWCVSALGVPDPDAANGRAQVTGEGGGPSLGRTCLGPFVPGQYVARLWMKVSDSARPASKLSIRMPVNLLHADGKSEPIVTVTYVTETLDAAAPVERRLVADGRYHEYSIPFELDTFRMIHVGPSDSLASPNSLIQARLFLDRVVIEQVEAYTDEWLSKKSPMPVPEDFTIGGKPGLDVLVVKGWTWDTYGLGRLEAFVPTNRQAEIWVASGEPEKFPATHDGLAMCDVVILANAGAAGLSHEGRTALRDFVKAGGRLVVLGGVHTLGQGGFRNTYLEDMIPVTLSSEKDVNPLSSPAVLIPGDTHVAARVGKAEWAKKAVVFWMHDVTAKPGAVVHVKAGDKPILVSCLYGKGTVILWAGTALGEAREGAVPFWEWSGWPALLRAMIEL